MKSFEKFKSQQNNRPGEVEQWSRGTFGLPPAVLERHLQIMTDLRTQGGSISNADKVWLLKQAKEAGRDVDEARRDIERVSKILNPEDRARAYVIASGAPDEGLVNQAVDLAKTYSTVWASTLAEDRLTERDEKAKSSQFHFEDSKHLKRSREESDSVRRSIEAALQSKGLIQREAQSLEEVQHRAVSYANAAANRLEATKDTSPLRDQIEAAWHVDKAFQRLDDAGVNDLSISQVMERTDEKSFASRALDE